MSEKRGKFLSRVLHKSGGKDEPDVEAHKHLAATTEPRSDDKPETPDVEGHAHLKKPLV